MKQKSFLFRRISAVHQDRLAGHPPAVGDEEADIGDDVLDVGEAGFGEAGEGRGRLMVGDGVRTFGRVEEGRIHRAGADGRDGDAASAELLGGGAGEVLDRRLCAGIGRIEGRKGAEQGGDERADLAVVADMFARFAQEEEGGFGVDRAHLVIFGLGDLDEGFLQNLADGVDGDVDAAERGFGIGKQLLDIGRAGEVASEGVSCGTGRLDRRYGFFRRRPGSGAVVMDGDAACAVLGEIARQEAAEVLRAAGDQNGFSLDAMVCHGRLLLLAARGGGSSRKGGLQAVPTFLPWRRRACSMDIDRPGRGV